MGVAGTAAVDIVAVEVVDTGAAAPGTGVEAADIGVVAGVAELLEGVVGERWWPRNSCRISLCRLMLLRSWCNTLP